MFSFKKVFFLLCFVILAIIVISAGKKNTTKYTPPISQPEQDKNYTLQWDGLDRTYQAHIPPQYANSSGLPLVIVFHGGLSNIEQAKKTLDFNKTADKNNFLVVYPQAIGSMLGNRYLGQWDAGTCCADGKVDDIGFISHMINEIEGNYKVDSKRIYVTGISNGSMMAFRTACELADKIAAVGGASGPGVLDKCTKESIPTIYFQGKADTCIPYNGPTLGTCFDTYFKILTGKDIKLPKWPVEPAPEFVKKLRDHNGTQGNAISVYQNKSASCTSWGYATPQEVEFCTIDNLGHTWAGQTTYGDDCANGMDISCKATIATLGSLNQDVIANDQIWNFFARHPKTAH